MSGIIDYGALRTAKNAQARFTPALGPNSSLPATLTSWAKLREELLTSKTVNGQGVVTGGTIAWPDGTSGVYTATTINGAFQTVDAWTMTYGSATITQPLITRDAFGNAITQPALVITGI